MLLETFLVNLGIAFGLASVLWLVSVKITNVSIIDPFWSLCIWLPYAYNCIRSGLSPGRMLLLVASGIWALRLFAYLLFRCIGKPEDARYAAFRKRFGETRYWWFSFFQVFALQALLSQLISLPLLAASCTLGSDEIRWNDIAGLAVFILGFLFEAASDYQLQVFKRNPENRGKLLDKGFFRYTRHPNYFGEATLWFGLWLMSVDAPWGIVSVAGPLLLLWLLLRVSGVTMLDQHLARTRPEYAAYAKRTSAFMPMPPRRL
jgi:steroid 5-alpha reductase family enzyme